MSNRFANRFWASSTSEDEATSDSESQSEESVESVKAAPKSKHIYDSDDESEEEKRVVKPPKYYSLTFVGLFNQGQIQ